MYYDERPRRFNVVSGLLCGAALGAGLALALAPSRRSGAARVGLAARELGRGAASSIGALPGRVAGLADGAARAGRKRFRL